jgi:hypothetical protein
MRRLSTALSGTAGADLVAHIGSPAAAPKAVGWSGRSLKATRAARLALTTISFVSSSRGNWPNTADSGLDPQARLQFQGPTRGPLRLFGAPHHGQRSGEVGGPNS